MDERNLSKDIERDTSRSTGEKLITEEFRVSGEALNAKIRALLRESNVRRIVVKNEAGHALVQIPLTVGVVGALLLPVWVGVSTAAALAARLSITVHRKVDDRFVDEALGPSSPEHTQRIS